MKKNIGTPFESWLEEEGIRQQVTAGAIKRVLARGCRGHGAERAYEDGDGAADADKPERAGLLAGRRE